MPNYYFILFILFNFSNFNCNFKNFPNFVSSKANQSQYILKFIILKALYKEYFLFKE